MKLDHQRNTAGVKEYAQKKRQVSYDKAKQALKELTSNNKPINFNKVAKLAGVSKTYLYKNQEIRSEIEACRERQNQVTNIKSLKNHMSDQSKDAKMEVLYDRIKELEKDNKELKEELKKLYGQIYSSKI
ncbi:DUF6262 family protein [Oceanobacillus saliphilus]|uniref:DUF6262 family protein n=1 Tax=Oceanobacillus saliphilus TaxID=2925834 RepID=UPI00201DB07E|nr:DUF6262 family protein [Oceanobacillus saliphilus]